MKILQRYVLRELWIPFVLCLVTLNFIFLGGYLVRAANFIVGRGVPFYETLYVIMLAMPDMISYTVPTSLLTAVLIVFGSLSQGNEIRAIKATGIHPLTVMIPVFALGLAMSILMFVFNDQLATRASFQLRIVTKQLLIHHPTAVIEPGRFVKLSDNLIFLTKDMNGNYMRDIVAYETEGDEKPIRTIISERGEIVSSADKNEIKIRLYDGSISDAEDSKVQSIQFKTYEFPTLGQEDIRKIQKKSREKTLAELLLKLPEVTGNKKDTREVWAAFHQRISFAFGCLIFAFVGIPVAILVHRGEIVLSFGIAMSAASLYYILFVGAKTIAIQSGIPAVIVFWMPNLIILALGAHLLKRALHS